MRNAPFDFAGRIAPADQQIALQYIGDLLRAPDLVIAPEGHGEYLFRWYVVPRNRTGNVYFHIQTESDPERPLHDHPWDNTSVILSGGYDEIINMEPDHVKLGAPYYIARRIKGDVIHRPATWAHRLIRPDNVPYTMSLFMTGPKVREWGFWENGQLTPFHEVTVETEGKSSWKGNMA